MFLPAFRDYAKAESYPIFGGLNKQLQHDYFFQKLQAFLKCEDRSSMAFGIESRVPFSDDTDLVSLAFQIPAHFKIEKGISKHILREASKAVLPKEIYERKDKVGFEAPLKKWLMSERKLIFDTLIDLDFIDKKRFPSIFEDLLERKPAVIFRLYSFAVWKEVFSRL
jgi:asparagine synthase (glutamine-hydrolysing)